MQHLVHDTDHNNGVSCDNSVLVQLHRRIDFLSLLQQVDVELNHTLELKSVLQIALSAAQIVSHADSGCIALFDAKGDLHSSGFGGYTEIPLLPDIGVPARALYYERSEFVPDVSVDPNYVAVIPSTQSQIVIPLLAHFKIVGLLNLETDTPSEFSPEVVEFSAMLASRIATAVENARLYEQSQAQLAELHALYQEMSALEQLKTDMIRVAAHDIRSPLSIIYSYIDMLNEDLAPHMSEHHRNAVRAIRKSVGRIDRMSADILTLERLQSNGEPPDDIVPLAMLLQSAIDELFDDCRSKNQQITLSVPTEPVYVAGDQSQLREAINNLIGNAIKYTPEKGCISARLNTVNGYALLEIEDNGCGILDTEQARLFEPFFRARMQETRGIEGNGLGLYLVKKIIERHRGQVVWQSAYKIGSTFGFRLPLYR